MKKRSTVLNQTEKDYKIHREVSKRKKKHWYKSIIPNATRKYKIEANNKTTPSTTCLAKEHALSLADQPTCLNTVSIDEDRSYLIQMKTELPWAFSWRRHQRRSICTDKDLNMKVTAIVVFFLVTPQLEVWNIFFIYWKRKFIQKEETLQRAEKRKKDGTRVMYHSNWRMSYHREFLEHYYKM